MSGLRLDEQGRLIGWLADRLAKGRVAVMTGAGCSTESGIPDYRGPETARRARNPIQYRGFVGDAKMRERYWARSFVGWPKIRDAVPNEAHRVLATFESLGLVTHLITQNVDRLHHKAGSKRVTELHGTLAEVACLECGRREGRENLQRRIIDDNGLCGEAPLPGLEAAPDGDADLADGEGAGFRVPVCLACGGTLKPDVVFFGESVPMSRVTESQAAVHAAEALLVIGSSLAVYSGLRFVRLARELGRTTALVNLGPPSRGLELFDVVIDGYAGKVLGTIAGHLGLATR